MACRPQWPRSERIGTCDVADDAEPRCPGTSHRRDPCRRGHSHRRGCRDGRRFGAARLSWTRGFLASISRLSGPQIPGHFPPEMVPRRSRTGLGLLWPSAEPLPRYSAARWVRHPSALGRKLSVGLFCLHQQCGRSISEGGVCTGARSGVPRLDPSPPMRGVLLQCDLAR